MLDKLKGIKPLFNSVQLKFTAAFLLVIAALLVMLNIYPTTISRDLVISSKENSMKAQAGVMSSALSTADVLTVDSVDEVLSLLNLQNMTRVVILDNAGLVLYDTARLDPAVGRYFLVPEVSAALSGKNVFHSVFDGKSFKSTEARPVIKHGLTIGAMYLYEYDAQQAELLVAMQTHLRRISVVLGIVSLALMLIFGRALTKRIKALVTATRIVSEGDYDHVIKVKGSDELSDLAVEFNALTSRLKETEEMRRRFVSDASHELKTPLASIRLLSDSIANSESMDTETMRDFVTDIGSEAERLQRITEKLLSLSRLDSHVDTPHVPTELAPVIRKTLHLLSPLAGEKDVCISTELTEGCTILGNEDLLYRIIFNLVENAIKYNKDGGEVNINLSKEDDRAVLKVEDTGVGIPEEDIPHIFSRFYRVDKARSREAGGSGLGLSIVHDAVELHGGTISVCAGDMGGSRFTVEFPLWHEPEEKQDNEQQDDVKEEEA